MTETSIPEQQDRQDRDGRRRSAGETLRLVLGLVLLAALVAFVVDNSSDVRVGWVVGDAEAPLAFVLLITAVAGAGVGWLLMHRPRRHRDPQDS